MNGSPTQILLAVSGGIDSMVMADRQYSMCGGDSFSIAHCNFSLRGAESDSDEKLVRQWAAERGVRFFSVRFDTVSEAASHRESIEMAARRLRYSWFAGLAAEHGFSEVHVAHNACDNAETLLLNLSRGTGLRGITGMRTDCLLEDICGFPVKVDAPRGASGDGSAENGVDVRLVRPLLGMSREEIEGYASTHSVPYHTDSTNSDTTYRRNAIRHNVLPALKEINPSIIRTLGDNMRHFAQASDALDIIYARESAKFLDAEGNIILSALDSVSTLRDYFLYRALEARGVSPTEIAEITALVTAAGAVTFSGKQFCGGHVVTASDRIIFRDPDDAGRSGICRKSSQADRELPRMSIRTISRPDNLELVRPKGQIICDWAALPSCGLRFRRWQPGDHIRPLGMRGTRLLSDIFSDRHLSIPEKEALTVLVPEQSSTGADSKEPTPEQSFTGADSKEPTPEQSSTGASAVLAVMELGIIDDKIKVTPQT
ncbi:MAG: tRNA lysidine(34) synthetase TilS, partial [Bacteroidales bacterium]|nr:tRNA lysidine(34) synthetase TilS [Bacteroidales bacterium]